MSTIHVEALVNREELLKAIAELDPAEFDQFVSEVLTLRAQRKAPRLPAGEAALLQRISQGLPDDLRARSAELVDKRHAGTLTAEEHAELLGLSDTMERMQANRAEALADLALRQVPLAKLMTDLGIPAPTDG